MEAEIVSGQSLRATAKRYQVTYQALTRHFNNHLKGDPVGTGEAMLPKTESKEWPFGPGPKTKPIEVVLTTTRNGFGTTCLVVYEDESTDMVDDIATVSMRGAQREMTGLLIANGYTPSGRWEATTEDDIESVRQFKPAKGSTF